MIWVISNVLYVVFNMIYIINQLVLYEWRREKHDLQHENDDESIQDIDREGNDRKDNC